MQLSMSSTNCFHCFPKNSTSVTLLATVNFMYKYLCQYSFKTSVIVLDKEQRNTIK